MANIKPIKLIVAAFFDNRQGHIKQTTAILDALERLTPITVTPHTLPPTTLTNRVRDYWQYFRANQRTNNLKTCENADIIIGTGSRCHLPMVIAKKYNPATKIVTCMTPERLLLNKFDLCLVPRHDSVSAARNIFMTNGPPCPVYNKRQHQTDKGLILAGGIDQKSHHWQTHFFVNQVQKIISLNPDILWTISSSPRTPQETVLLLEEIGRNSINANFFRAEDTPSGWIEEQYETNKTVWVTADSISMVYEALSAGCSVGVLPVKWKKKNNKFQHSLSFLIKENLITPFEKWQKGQQFSNKTINLQEAQRCAEEILRRWWPNRLQ